MCTHRFFRPVLQKIHLVLSFHFQPPCANRRSTKVIYKHTSLSATAIFMFTQTSPSPQKRKKRKPKPLQQVHLNPFKSIWFPNSGFIADFVVSLLFILTTVVSGTEGNYETAGSRGWNSWEPVGEAKHICRYLPMYVIGSHSSRQRTKIFAVFLLTITQR